MPGISVSISPRSPGPVPEGRVTVSDVESHAASKAEKLRNGTQPLEGLLSAARKTLIEQMERGHREIPQISISRNLERDAP